MPADLAWPAQPDYPPPVAEQPGVYDFTTTPAMPTAAPAAASAAPAGPPVAPSFASPAAPFSAHGAAPISAPSGNTPLGALGPDHARATIAAPQWTPDLTDLMLAQKSVIWSLLLRIVVYVLRVGAVAFFGPAAILTAGGGIMSMVASLLSLVAFVLSLWGIRQMAASLGYPGLSRVGLYVLMCVPIISLVTLLLLNVKATKRLRDGGYTVGLMGATA